MEIHLELPKKWSDLRQGQLEELAGLFLQYRDKPEFLTRCFLLFSGWRILSSKAWKTGEGEFCFRARKGKRFMISIEVFRELASKLNWILEKFWITTYTPEIKGFEAPNPMIYNVTFEQYLAADNYYQGYIASGDPATLDKMIAALYRKDFLNLKIEKEIRKLKRISVKKKHAVFIWYSGLKNWICQKYPYLYSSSTGPASENPDEVFLKILSALNNGDITLNRKILETPVHEALYELNQKIENHQNQKHV